MYRIVRIEGTVATFGHLLDQRTQKLADVNYSNTAGAKTRGAQAGDVIDSSMPVVWE